MQTAIYVRHVQPEMKSPTRLNLKFSNLVIPRDNITFPTCFISISFQQYLSRDIYDELYLDVKYREKEHVCKNYIGKPYTSYLDFTSHYLYRYICAF